MPTLAEFLKSEHERIQATQAEREAVLTEWRAAVERLLTQITEWVTVGDPVGLLQTQIVPTEAFQENFGWFAIHSLVIRYRDASRKQEVTVVPKSTATVAQVTIPGSSNKRTSSGVVHLCSTNGAEPSSLYRVKTEQGDEWYYHRPRWGQRLVSPNGKVADYLPLTRDLFEQLLITAIQ